MRFPFPPPPSASSYLPYPTNERTLREFLTICQKKGVEGIDWALSIGPGVHSGPLFARKI